MNHHPIAYRTRGRRAGAARTLAASLFAGLIASISLVAVAGCSSRDDVQRRFEAALVSLTPLTWGEAAVPEILATERARFACLWDRLDHPEDEFECQINNFDATRRCLERAGGDDDAMACLAPERLPCPISAAFREASAACPPRPVSSTTPPTPHR